MSKRDVTRRTVLKSAAGLVAASAGLAAFSGSAAAHWEPDLEIDVKPGSDRNAINPRSRGVTRVAVLATDEFDPTEEDVRYRFGSPEEVENGDGANSIRNQVKDVDGDGNDDLVLFFRTAEAGFRGDETEAVLYWDRDEGREHGLSGRDAVTLVGDR
jgi:hypothetical protein